MNPVVNDLAKAVNDLAKKHGDAELIRNQVGNLVFLDTDGLPEGWIDVLWGEWHYFDVAVTEDSQ